VNVVVDEEMCQQTEFCVQVAPAMFAIGDDGVAHVLVQPHDEETMALAREAYTLCPTRAIALNEA